MKVVRFPGKGNPRVNVTIFEEGDRVTAPGPGTITSYVPPTLHSSQQRLSDYTAKVIPLPD